MHGETGIVEGDSGLNQAQAQPWGKSSLVCGPSACSETSLCLSFSICKMGVTVIELTSESCPEGVGT